MKPIKLMSDTQHNTIAEFKEEIKKKKQQATTSVNINWHWQRVHMALTLNVINYLCTTLKLDQEYTLKFLPIYNWQLYAL